MKLSRELLAGFIFITGVLNAQPDFKRGYIIKKSGDTVAGEINYTGDINMSKICEFRNAENEIVEYFPNDILGYRFSEGRFYVSKKVNKTKVFLEYVIKGKVNVYYMADIKGDHYYIDKHNMQLSEIFYEEKLRYVDDVPYYTRSTRHYGILYTYMKDDPDIQKCIQTIKIPSRKNLIKLAKMYQHDVGDGENCVVFEKKPPVINVAVIPFTGVTKYKVFNSFVNEMGGFIYFNSPRSSMKHFYLKTGLVHHRLKEYGNNLDIFKIPLQLQYIYSASRLQPWMSGGFNVFIGTFNDNNFSAQTFSLNIGLDYRISKKFYLSTGFNSDYPQMLKTIMNDSYDFDIVSYSIIIGLRINILDF